MRHGTRSATAMDKFESSYRALASLLNAGSQTMAQLRQSFSGDAVRPSQRRRQPVVAACLTGRANSMIRFRCPTAGWTLIGVSNRGAEGEEKMNDRPSLSIFTIEGDGKPVLAFGAKRYSEAQAICTDEQLRTKLSSLKSGAVPLCGDNAIL